MVTRRQRASSEAPFARRCEPCEGSTALVSDPFCAGDSRFVSPFVSSRFYLQAIGTCDIAGARRPETEQQQEEAVNFGIGKRRFRKIQDTRFYSSM
jgi:hypothetical protein